MAPKTIDYRGLLERYMRHVAITEGVDFVFDIHADGSTLDLPAGTFTAEEVAELRRISDPKYDWAALDADRS